MNAHIISKLPQEHYLIFLTTYEIQCYSTVSLVGTFQQQVKDFWRSNIKGKDKMKMAMTTIYKERREQHNKMTETIVKKVTKAMAGTTFSTRQEITTQGNSTTCKNCGR